MRANSLSLASVVEDKEWHEDEEKIEDCEGEECHVENGHPMCDECDEGDDMCMEKCQVIDPSESGDFPDGKKKMSPRRHERIRMTKKKGIRKGPLLRYKKAMKHRGKGPHMKPGMRPSVMVNMGPMRRMQRPGMRPKMRPPMMGHMGPMGRTKRPGMKSGIMRPMMSHMGSSMGRMGLPHGRMGKMMPRHKMMMETGPIMYYPKVRSEFYTKVIFKRNGTCNAIVSEPSCYGERKNIKIRAGRVGKTPISVPMCPKPTFLKETTAQFTCDTGASFLDPVILPEKCSYAPCGVGFWIPDWSEDNYWNGENAYSGDYWGTKDWWSFDERGDKDNWFLGQSAMNRIHKDQPFLRWRGEHRRNL